MPQCAEGFNYPSIDTNFLPNDKPSTLISF